MTNRAVTPEFSSLHSVVSADDGQIYKFDRNGFHVQTTDVMTNTIMYNFTMYPRNSLSGALVQVTGRGGQVIGECQLKSHDLHHCGQSEGRLYQTSLVTYCLACGTHCQVLILESNISYLTTRH